MIDCLIFSKNRAAQLDLLLQSIEKFAPSLYNSITVLTKHTTEEHKMSYAKLQKGYPNVYLVDELNFDKDVKNFIKTSDQPLYTFLVDDDIFFRPVKITPEQIHELIYHTTRVFSLRLGKQYKYIKDFYLYKDYMMLPRQSNIKCATYPMSVDGNIFDTKKIGNCIDKIDFINPNKLESKLHHNFANKFSNIYCVPDQCLVGVPINRVSDTSRCIYGEEYGMNENEICNRFMNGERFYLEDIDFSKVNNTHVELKMKMR